MPSTLENEIHISIKKKAESRGKYEGLYNFLVADLIQALNKTSGILETEDDTTPENFADWKIPRHQAT